MRWDARRNFLVPVPRVASWDELNAHLLEQCRKQRGRTLRGEQAAPYVIVKLPR